MSTEPFPLRLRRSARAAAGVAGLLLAWVLLPPPAARAAGVTLITHGLNGNVDGWVTGMANQIPNHPGFPETNHTLYKVYFYSSNSTYYATWSRLGGSPPAATDSGEIIVAFDWRQLAGGNTYNTYQIATTLSAVLLSTNFISELNGHALCELPIHLIGHSRGGSLVCETSRRLGTNGVWVDHLTTLDPHPLNDPSFPLDFLLYSAVDAPCATYQNVLFHDNYWQNLSSVVYGKSVAGAYIRKLTNLSGGYQNIGASYYQHSNVHLWYHGTVDERVPASDTEAQMTTNEFNTWYVPAEASGEHAGFLWSLLGGGDRTSTETPLGFGTPMIRSGFNQFWDLGGGTNANRTALPGNNGTWPNVLRFQVTDTNAVAAGSPVFAALTYQYAGASNLTLQVYCDPDENAYNSNSVLIAELHPPVTGANSVSNYPALGLSTLNIPPGVYALCAQITDGGHSRYLYAPQPVRILSSRQPPLLEIVPINDTQSNGRQIRIGVNGISNETIVLLTSTNLQTWQPLATNTLTTSRWDFTNTLPLNFSHQFYRARLEP